MRLPVATLALLLLAGAAAAHHGFTGRYDRSQPVWIEGTVIAANFGYPHAVLTLLPDQGARPVDPPETAEDLATGLAA